MLEQAILARTIHPPPPTALRCGLMLLALKLGLRAWGFGRVIKWITRHVEQIPASTRSATDSVKAVERVVAVAGALYPGRARCLEQSLVLYYLLRRRGVAAQYCQGVMAYPFEAHAWVEYRGEVLNDIPEHVESFARLPAQLP